MIWQHARVVENRSGRLLLAFAAAPACSRCARGEGCGAGVFSGLFPARRSRLEVDGEASIEPGEWVRVGIHPRLLALAAALHYGLPLAAFLVFASAAHFLLPAAPAQDLAALLAGLAGFGLAVAMSPGRMSLALNPAVERLSCRESDSNSTITSKQ